MKSSTKNDEDTENKDIDMKVWGFQIFLFLTW